MGATENKNERATETRFYILGDVKSNKPRGYENGPYQ